METAVPVGVLGATGYVGAELVRLLAEHPRAAVRAVGSRQQAGRPLAEALPALPGLDLELEDEAADPRAWRERGIEVVFAALPHGAFAARAQEFLDAGLRVVDLSSDFRLRSAAEYRRRYGLEHPAPHLLGASVYGLTEWCDGALAGAHLIANPGCYATAVLLAALPAVAAGVWSRGPIIASALSGVSGAGRAPSLTTHFGECGNTAAPYKVGEVHAHLGEIGQAIGAAAARAAAGGGAGVLSPSDAAPAKAPIGARAVPPMDSDAPTVVFNPHLVPMARGIVANVAIPLRRPIAQDEARQLYVQRYAASAFLRVLDAEALPETRHVRGSNRCDLAVRVADRGRLLLAFAALDNLIKGAAGQAIQNWNLMQGWPESTGLPLAAWACA